jgi:hypothetical protein
VTPCAISPLIRGADESALVHFLGTTISARSP